MKWPRSVFAATLPVHAIASKEEINLGQSPNSRQTAASQSGGSLHEDPLRVYALLRERIVQEDTLINHRMGWFLFFHAILLAFIGVIFAQNTIKSDCINHDYGIYWLCVMVCFLGSLISLGTSCSIIAAKNEIGRIVRIYETEYPQSLKLQKQGKIPSLTGDMKWHFLGYIVNTYVPVLFIFVWIGFAIHVERTCG
jgi:hypothetical protein